MKCSPDTFFFNIYILFSTIKKTVKRKVTFYFSEYTLLHLYYVYILDHNYLKIFPYIIRVYVF